MRFLKNTKMWLYYTFAWVAAHFRVFWIDFKVHFPFFKALNILEPPSISSIYVTASQFMSCGEYFNRQLRTVLNLCGIKLLVLAVAVVGAVVVVIVVVF